MCHAGLPPSCCPFLGAKYSNCCPFQLNASPIGRAAPMPRKSCLTITTSRYTHTGQSCQSTLITWFSEADMPARAGIHRHGDACTRTATAHLASTSSKRADVLCCCKTGCSLSVFRRTRDHTCWSYLYCIYIASRRAEGEKHRTHSAVYKGFIPTKAFQSIVRLCLSRRILVM